MANKENDDVADIKSIQEQLNRKNAKLKDTLEKLVASEENNEQLRADNIEVMIKNDQWRKDLDGHKKIIANYQKRSKSNEHLADHLQEYVSDMVRAFKAPVDSQMTLTKSPTLATVLSASSTILTSASAMTCSTPINVSLTQTQTLHVRSNAADAQLVEHENSGPFAVRSRPESFDKIAQKIIGLMSTDNVERLAKRLIELVDQAKGNAGEHEETVEPTTTAMTSSNNDAVTPRANVDDEAATEAVANGNGTMETENEPHQNGSLANVGREKMDITVPPSPTSTPTQTPPSTPAKQQTTSQEANAQSIDPLNESNSNAPQDMSADDTIASPSKQNDTGATVVEESPSANDITLGDMTSPSIFATPTTTHSRKKRQADDSGNIDTKAKRKAGSKAKAVNGNNSNLSDAGSSAASSPLNKSVRFNVPEDKSPAEKQGPRTRAQARAMAPQPRKIRDRRKTTAV